MQQYPEDGAHVAPEFSKHLRVLILEVQSEIVWDETICYLG